MGDGSPIMRPSEKHVLGVLEWSYVVPEKPFFSSKTESLAKDHTFHMKFSVHSSLSKIFYVLLASMSWLATDRSPSICISLTLIQSDRPLQHVFVIRSMVSSSNFSVLGIFYSFINWNSTRDVSGEIFLISHPKALFGKIVVDIFSLSSQMETNALNRATKNGVVCLPYIYQGLGQMMLKKKMHKKNL